MPARIFFDTNVLVYAYDSHNAAKQARAQNLIVDAIENESGVISTQVLGEFFCVVTRRIPKPLSAEQAQGIINELGILEIVEIDLPMINRAIEVHKKHQLAYWDAMIIASAERGNCAQVFSEDLNAGQHYGRVKAMNPFA